MHQIEASVKPLRLLAGNVQETLSLPQRSASFQGSFLMVVKVPGDLCADGHLCKDLPRGVGLFCVESLSFLVA